MPAGKVIGLGSAGDGIVESDGKRYYVPGCLLNENVEFEPDETGKRGRLVRVLSCSKERAEPLCPYFGRCGGCSLQHMSLETYKRFKLNSFKALFPPDFDFSCFEDPIFVPHGTRRRVTFGVMWNGKMRRFGLNESKSGRIVPVERCILLTEALERLIVPLRDFFEKAPLSFGTKKGVGDVSVLWADNGADILITLPIEADLRWRQEVSEIGHQLSIARISWRRGERDVPEPLFVGRAPVLDVFGFSLKPPAGAFLQPSREGERALQDKVREYVGKSMKVADLFCGAGTFSLPLLEKKRKIYGVDTASFSLKALESASEGRIKTECRDLFRTPLFSDELDEYDAVVFDPPRAGAKAQSEQIARSSVPVVVAVSCNPSTFARDAEILSRGGYVMKRLTPVDQFIYSPHTELVALFEK